MATTKATKSRPSPRRRRSPKNAIPGLEDRVGEAAIEEGLGEAAAEAPQEPAAAPEPPPEPVDLLKAIAADAPPSPLKTPIQTIFASCGGMAQSAAAKAKPADLWAMPDWEANLYGNCAEIALRKRQLSLERYAEWVLLIGLGGRVLFNLWLLRKAEAAARARPAPAAPPPAA